MNVRWASEGGWPELSADRLPGFPFISAILLIVTNLI